VCVFACQCDALDAKRSTQAVTIPAGKVVTQKVAVSGSQAVQYWFKTAHYNLKWSVAFVPEGAAESDAVAVAGKHSQGVQESQTQAVSGVVAPGAQGTVVFSFDNYDSYFNAKQLTLQATVRDATADDCYYHGL
jgi:hypothetical protein